MKKKFLVFTALITFSFALFGKPNFISGNSTLVEDNSWDGVVGLKIYDASGFSVCTGTMLAPNIVLTAAHCVKLNNKNYNIDVTNTPDKVSVMTGPQMMKFVSYGEKIVVHENWIGYNDGSPFSTDIALIKLQKTSKLPYHKIASKAPVLNTTGHLIGYGLTQIDASDDMKKRAGTSKILKIDNNLIMLGDPNGTCTGDSGGPFFVEENGEFVVYGVTSFGYQVCDPMKDNYDTNVYAFNFWINEKMAELLDEPVVVDNDTVTTDDDLITDNTTPVEDNDFITDSENPVSDSTTPNDSANEANDSSNTVNDSTNTANDSSVPANNDEVVVEDETSGCGCSIIF